MGSYNFFIFHSIFDVVYRGLVMGLRTSFGGRCHENRTEADKGGGGLKIQKKRMSFNVFSMHTNFVMLNCVPGNNFGRPARLYP